MNPSMLRTAWIGLVLAMSAGPAWGAPYIVLLKTQPTQAPAPGIDKKTLPTVAARLQAQNQARLSLLQQYLNAQPALRGKSVAALTPIEDLWIVHGAVVDVDASDAARLRNQPWVERVVEDQYRRWISPRATPGVASSLREIQARGSLWGLDEAGVLEAREQWPKLTGKGVRIGILDTGIQGRHPEFKSVSGLVFRDFVNGIKRSFDDQGHGTHVAGTIAGVATGVAPEATLVVGKILNGAGSGYTSVILKGMQWMLDPDGDPMTDDQPRIVSNSWGGDFEDESAVAIEEVAIYRDAIQAWLEAGIVPVFAAGNSGKAPNGLPAALPEAIAVGAIDREGQIAEFSSRGNNFWIIDNAVVETPKPDFSTPGVDIGSSVPGNRYAIYSGTSMATPHLSGMIGILLQADPTLSPVRVLGLLRQAAAGVSGHSKTFGYGKIRLPALLRAAGLTPQQRQ